MLQTLVLTLTVSVLRVTPLVLTPVLTLELV
jgi:hypothetical protein